MADQISPLDPVYRTGSHGNFADGTGVRISQPQPGSIVQVAAWPGQEAALISLVGRISSLAVADRSGSGDFSENAGAFGFAPGKFMVVDQEEGLAARYTEDLTTEIGTVTDLSHGRTNIRIEGPKAEWVLAKFFAIDFDVATFPVKSGISTTHHDIFTMIQRSGEDRFDLYVYRSFARSFFTALCHAAEEVGYELA